jgi:acetyl-CoA acetyltransferase
MARGILSFGRDDDDIVVVAFAETPILRNTGRSAYELAADVAEALFKQSGLEPGDIDGFSTVLPLSEAGNPFWANYCAEYLGISPIWHNLAACGGASVLSGIAAAATALSDQRCELALLVHADAPSTRDLSAFGAHRAEIADPTGLFGAPGAFGMIMTRYIAEYGLDRNGLANLLCTQRSNAASNDLSYPKLRSSVTPNDYLLARIISEPLTLLDSVMPCDGANGLILMRGGTAARRRLRAMARLLSYGEITNPDIHHPHADMLLPGHGCIATAVLEAAGVRREDLDLLCLYDDFLIAVALQLEAFGYCARF